VSTFSPTKKEANVPNVNTIPGLDVFCLDSRVLPRYPLAEVLAEIDRIKAGVEKEHGVSISHEVLQRHESPPTSADCALVRAVRAAVKRVYGVEAAPMGVGGGTVGAFLRQAGYDTVVWTRLADTCHMPNEYCLLDNLIGDAKVMLELMAGFSG
jgi:succinyl-diaminopimelate desuccinylase